MTSMAAAALAPEPKSAGEELADPPSQPSLAAALDLLQAKDAGRLLLDAAGLQVADFLIAQVRAAAGDLLDEPPLSALKIMAAYVGRLHAEILALQADLRRGRLDEAELTALDPLPLCATLAKPPTTAPASRFDLDVGRPFLGANWHAPETKGHRCWRWSGPQARSTIVLPSLGSGRLRLCLTLDPGPDRRVEEVLRVEIGGSAVALERQGDGLLWTGDFDHDDADPLGHLVVHLIVDPLFEPAGSARDGGSRRKLGVCLHGLQLVRLPAA